VGWNQFASLDLFHYKAVTMCREWIAGLLFSCLLLCIALYWVLLQWSNHWCRVWCGAAGDRLWPRHTQRFIHAQSLQLAWSSRCRRCSYLHGPRVSFLGCLHDPANIQQTSSKCIQNTRGNAGRLLDRVNTLSRFYSHILQLSVL